MNVSISIGVPLSSTALHRLLLVMQKEGVEGDVGAYVATLLCRTLHSKECYEHVCMELEQLQCSHRTTTNIIPFPRPCST